jgi:hypothetical protein
LPAVGQDDENTVSVVRIRRRLDKMMTKKAQVTFVHFSPTTTCAAMQQLKQFHDVRSQPDVCNTPCYFVING